jgi:hypothetical protein
MKPPRLKVVGAVGVTEVPDAYAMVISRARYQREKGVDINSRAPPRFPEDIHYGPPAEQQKTFEVGGERITTSTEPMCPNLPYAVHAIFYTFASVESAAFAAKYVPAMFELSEKETTKAAAAVWSAIERYNPASWWELVWCLAVQQAKKGTKGRKGKWVGMEGVLLVEDIELKLQELGLRKRKKGILTATVEVRKENLQWYGHVSPERLRDAYYAALPHRDALRALCGKS